MTECAGGEQETEIDSLLNEIEEKISVAKGKNLITNDRHDEIITQVSDMREINSRLKCLVSEIPDEKVEPSDFLSEIDERVGVSPETVKEVS